MKTRARPFRSSLWMTLCIGCLIAIPAVLVFGAEDRTDRVTLRYERDPAARRNPEKRPPTKAVPSRFLLPLPEVASREGTIGGARESAATAEALRRRRDQLPPADPAGDPSLPVEELAARAAHWTAQELSRTVGWREYYRLGAWDGMREALEDESLGAWDFTDGLRVGARDPEAIRVGEQIGVGTAQDLGREVAEADIEREFSDLSREPSFTPTEALPDYIAGDPWTVEPELRLVFEQFASSPYMSRELAEIFHEWRFDPWGFYECSSYEDFHDPHWKNPEGAFHFWRDQNGRRLRHLSREDWIRFQTVFETRFGEILPFYFERYNRRAFHLGVEEGWEWGAFVRSEWQFRLGYREGFDHSVDAAAGASFRTAYGPSYSRSYNEAFRYWSDNPVPGLVNVWLGDGNDDGIFEPGEEILARYEIANYGGRSATLDVTLDGQALERPGGAPLVVPSRSLVRDGDPVRSRVRTDTPPRSRSAVVFRAADLHREMSLLISYPLEFSDPVRIVHVEAADGQAVLEARIVNRSRRAVEARVELDPDPRFQVIEATLPGTLPAGATRPVEFVIGQIDPIDLLAGRIEAHLSTGDGAKTHDRMRFPFPNLSLDLQSRELVRYMGTLAEDPTAVDRDIEAARSLLLERLRVEWRAVVRGSGNPYKRDFKGRTAETTMGDLVQLVQAQRNGSALPKALRGLDDEVLPLVKKLPGAHPRLRKFMKRLAQQLG